MSDIAYPFQFGDLVTIKEYCPILELKTGDIGIIKHVYDDECYEVRWPGENGDWENIFCYEELLSALRPLYRL